MTNSYPLLFQFDDLVAGNGFLSRITAHGRALLCEEEEGGFWMYGVTPAGCAGGGKERSEALVEFKRSYLSVLFDIAAEACDESAFESEARAFFAIGCESIEEEWRAARAKVLSGELDLPGMKRVNGDIEPFIDILTVETPSSQANPQQEDFVALPRAA